MEFIINEPIAEFDTEKIKPGGLLYGKYKTWEEGKAGFVSAVNRSRITVHYHPGIGNITNHFHIPVEEVVAEDWIIRYSDDLKTIITNETEEPQDGDSEDVDDEI